ILRTLPRSTGLLIGPSYTFLLTRILPSLNQGLEMFGYYKDLHYFVGRQPPRSWRRSWGTAFQPPEKYSKYITFWNGVGIHLISHDVKGDGRGINSDWIDGDEAALLDPSKLQENTDPTLRGTRKKAFQGKPLFGSTFYTSSTPLTPEGQWFVDLEQKAEAEPDKISFISATCEYNLDNLRDGYLDDARRRAISEQVYLAEYENVRPRFGRDAFYFLLNPDLHAYVPKAPGNYDFHENIGTGDCRTDTDLVPTLPLILGLDWGGAINCLVTCQHLRSINEFRALKSMYALGEQDKIQDDLLADFDRYYRHHPNKTLHLFYDASGNHRTGNTRITRAQQARDQLTKLGWKVQLMTQRTMNIDHAEKFLLWEVMLRGDHPHLPSFRINRLNAKDLYIAMRFARTKQGRHGDTRKDKSSEKSSAIPRQHATDLTDAIDIPVYEMFYHMLRYRPSGLLNVHTHTF
ncbi:MAG: hypothetical protein AAFY91_02080, partial [Bacteroidota bacterium]